MATLRVPKVLVACEMSGRVRTAFAKRGWFAKSADILPDESQMWNSEPMGSHYQGDVLDIIKEDWDLVIAHPPCTDLSQAGARYWKQKDADGRIDRAMEFFMSMLAEPSQRAYVAVENPVGIPAHRYREPDQVVQPYWFGDPYKKKICLWYRPAIRGRHLHEYLDNLPGLHPTNMVEPTGRITTGGGSWRVDAAAGLTAMNKNWEDSQGRARRSILRSITSEGLAQAMADQWGSYVEDRIARS